MRCGKSVSVLFVALAVFLGVDSGTVLADEFHYNNILVGERAAGLGGAYTAVSDDPSGLFYNPAGIVYSLGSNLSASVNAFYRSEKQYDTVLGGGWTRRGYALLPNFFGIIQPLGEGKIGFSYAVPDSIVEEQDQVFHDVGIIRRYIINFNNEDNTYHFGPSYARAVNKSLSLGMTLYVHHRKKEQSVNQLLLVDDAALLPGATLPSNAEYEWRNVYFETTEWGIRPVVGLMWSPEDQKFSVGLTVSRIYLIESDTYGQSSCKGYDFDSDSDGINDTDLCGGSPSQADVVRQDIRADDKREYPYVITLGGAYFPSNRLLVTTDLSYYTSTDGTITTRRRSFFNVAVGSEYYLTPSLALRAGLFTNAASTYSVSAGRQNQPEHVNIYGGGLSFSYFTRGSSLTIGASYSRGSGDAQIISGSSNVQGLEVTALMIYAAASYSY